MTPDRKRQAPPAAGMGDKPGEVGESGVTPFEIPAAAAALLWARSESQK